MTDAELAILSLLAEGPSYDHDLNDAIDARGLRRWTAIGNSSMYYVLEKLEKQGLVEKLSDQFGHRKYGISAAGTGVLQTAVADLLSMPHSFDRAFELGLANLHILKSGQVRTALLGRQQDIQMQLGKTREQRLKASGDFKVEALFDHSIAMLEAEQAWLEQFIPRWEAQAPAEVIQNIEPSITPRIKQVILPQDPDSVHKQATRESKRHEIPDIPADSNAPASNTPPRTVREPSIHDTKVGVDTRPPISKPKQDQTNDGEKDT